MKISYKSKKLERNLTVDKDILKAYSNMAKKVKMRMIQLKAAENLGVIAKLPSLRLHQYAGNRKGEWSIDLHKNWRIIFEVNHNPIPRKDDDGVDINVVTAIKITSVEDPH